MRHNEGRWPCVIALVVWILQACGSSSQAGSADFASGAPPSGVPGGSWDGGAAAGGSSRGAGGSGGAGDLPPEREVESAYEVPAATDRFVWVANPLSGRVAYVDGTTLEVRTTEAGHSPTYLAAVPNQKDDTAIVINTQSQNATLLRADAAGNLSTATLSVAADNNSWAFAPSGKWAIAWTDYRLKRSSDLRSVDGYQDITAIDLTPGAEKAWRLSVGFRPVAFGFSSDDQRACAVTQDGISVIELPGTPRAVKVVSLTADPLVDPRSRDVAITPDGNYALVRQDGSASVTIVDIGTEVRTEVVLPGEVSDLDLSRSGEQAIAVVRATSDVAVLPIPGIVANPSGFALVHASDLVVGSASLARAADVALLYSNASQQQRLGELRYATGPLAVHTIKLHAPVLAVFPAPGGSNAIILHDKIASNPDAGTTGSSAPGAFSVLSLEPELPARLQSLQAPALAVAISPGGDRAMVAERDDTKKVFGVYVVRTGTQQVDRYELASPPLSVGTLTGANRGFVAQKHPEGRITFIDLDTGMARTLTGFELGARVVNGPKGK